MDDAGEHEVWSERAQPLLAAMEVMSSPIRMGSLLAFAQRKGWEPKTLEGIVGYAERHRLVERYRAFDGKVALKLTGRDAPTVEPADDDDDEDEDVVDEDEEDADAAVEDEDEASPTEAAELQTIVGCLCARTAPMTNYGCPEHGGARVAKEDHDMAKDWISTAEAAELLAVDKRYAVMLAHRKKIEAKRDGSGGRAPFLFARASVIAYRDQRAKKKAATDLLPATPVKRKTAAPKSSSGGGGGSGAIVLQTKAIDSAVLEGSIDMTDVRALVRIVDRCGMGKEAAWEWLRTIVAA